MSNFSFKGDTLMPVYSIRGDRFINPPG